MPAAPPVVVPASIAGDCSADVTDPLNAWIAGVPDGEAGAPTVLAFAAGGCYRIEQKLVVTDRKHLRFDGRGATFKATTPGDGDRKQWQVYGGVDIAFADMTVEGVNHDVVDGAYNTATEWQHLFSFWGTQGVLVERVTGRWAYGDFVGLDADYRKPVAEMTPVRDAVIRDSTFVGAGRMGISTNYAENLTIERNSFDRVMWSVVDLEVEYSAWSIRNVRVADNTIGELRHSFVANAGWNTPTDNVTITGNTMLRLPTTNQPNVHIAGGTIARSHWLIEHNVFRSLTWAVHARGVRDLVVRDNVAHSAQDEAVAVEVFSSHDGTVTGNDFAGYPTVFRQDTASTGWTVCGNRTSTSSGFVEPRPC